MFVDTEAAASATKEMTSGADALTGAAADLRAHLSAIGSPGHEGSALTGALDEFITSLTGAADGWARLRGSVAGGMGQSVATARSADDAATRVLASGDQEVTV
ncbi:hypothetical protein [Nonomuraea rhizosphaerae]|uniref:hypothetical protein n=1 Tax=Nonomuraea rhizosphaerae TaxID=2665663 RepID=UPI001C5E85C8|nr:hypothetical protein [Nonomuraea rhizosphaerae]